MRNDKMVLPSEGLKKPKKAFSGYRAPFACLLVVLAAPSPIARSTSSTTESPR